jgi:hypothetical protein
MSQIYVADYFLFLCQIITSGKLSIENPSGPVRHNIFFLARLFGELTPELGNPVVFNL